MCGRFALYTPYPELAEALRLPLEVGEAEPRYNVAPGTWIPAVRRHDEASPPVLDDESLEPWLDPDLTDRETLRQVVHHLGAKRIVHCPVSQRVNKPTENDPRLIEPVKRQ